MTTKQAQRTPGPWHRYGLSIWSSNKDKDGIVIAELLSASNQDIANAEFIVEACNAHDAHLARIAELEAALAETVKELRMLNLRQDGDQKLNTPASLVIGRAQVVLSGSRSESTLAKGAA